MDLFDIYDGAEPCSEVLLDQISLLEYKIEAVSEHAEVREVGMQSDAVVRRIAAYRRVCAPRTTLQRAIPPGPT